MLKKIKLNLFVLLIKDLEAYTNDHLFVDALDDPKLNIEGPITQYRKFEVNYQLIFIIFFK